MFDQVAQHIEGLWRERNAAFLAPEALVYLIKAE
jgi:hypothetical protein